MQKIWNNISRRMSEGRMYQIIKDYRDHEALRQSFDALAQKTFGLSFEDWYQLGYWSDCYNPHSIFLDGKIVANVSVNQTDLLWDKEVKHLIQLGTVMTEEAYRHQGLCKCIIEDIFAEWEGRADGFYLWANNSAVDLYPKFGFVKGREIQYQRTVSIQAEPTMRQVPMRTRQNFEQLRRAMQKSRPFGRFALTGNEGLFLFYVTKFMQQNVYYSERLNTYAIAEVKRSHLHLNNVFCPQPRSVREVVEAFGPQIEQITLGFTPEEEWDYIQTELPADDNQFFTKGAVFAAFEEQKLRFEELAHA